MEISHLFLQLAVMLLTGLLGGQIMRLIKQPAVIGELLGGILLGPTLCGALLPNLYGQLFPPHDPFATAREALLNLGMLFFLFIAGSEINHAHFNNNRRAIIFTATFSAMISFSLGFTAVILFPGWWNPPAGTANITLALFLGIALTITALPIIARILIDLGILQSELGSIIMTAAAVNDLAGWTAFALLLSTRSSHSTSSWSQSLALTTGGILAILGGGYLFGRPLLRRIRTLQTGPTGSIALITIFILLAATLAEAVGMHAVLGAFLLGIALSPELKKSEPAPEIIRQFTLSFFAPLYFVSIGLKGNYLANLDIPLTLTILILACLGKIGGSTLGARLGKLPWRSAWAIGFAMNARGAIEILLASLALEAGLIDLRIYVAIVIMAILTSILGGPALKRLI